MTTPIWFKDMVRATQLCSTTIQQVRIVHQVFKVEEPMLPTLPGLTPEVKVKLGVAAAFLKALSKEFRAMANDSIVAHRTSLELEEMGEVLEAVAEGNLVEVLREKVDQRVVNDGTLLAYGIAPVFKMAFDRIIASQFTKLGEDGEPIKVDGKFVKGPNYQKPDLTDLIE
jgi:hypothetical protein